MRYTLPSIFLACFSVVVFVVGFFMRRARTDDFDYDGTIAMVAGFFVLAVSGMWAINTAQNDQVRSQIVNTAKGFGLSADEISVSMNKSTGTAELKHDACSMQAKWHTVDDKASTEHYVFYVEDGSGATGVNADTVPKLLQRCAR